MTSHLYNLYGYFPAVSLVVIRGTAISCYGTEFNINMTAPSTSTGAAPHDQPDFLQANPYPINTFNQLYDAHRQGVYCKGMN
jgi:hypothetical protein